jgi:hypothetical protein
MIPFETLLSFLGGMDITVTHFNGTVPDYEIDLRSKDNQFAYNCRLVPALFDQLVDNLEHDRFEAFWIGAAHWHHNELTLTGNWSSMTIRVDPEDFRETLLEACRRIKTL